MAEYLIEHPNPHARAWADRKRAAGVTMPAGHASWSYPQRIDRGRAAPILAIVVHCTAGAEDTDGGPDPSAQDTAAYASRTERTVSWHSGSDSDDVVQLLPPAHVAFHVRGFNTHTYGHEISKRHMRWAPMPRAWVDSTLDVAARHLAPIATAGAIPVRTADRGDLLAAIDAWRRHGIAKPVGFIGHAALDPGRRSDPGEDFPWLRFLDRIRHHMEGTVDPSPEGIELFRIRQGATVWTTNGAVRWPIATEEAFVARYGADAWARVIPVEPDHVLATLPRANGT